MRRFLPTTWPRRIAVGLLAFVLLASAGAVLALILARATGTGTVDGTTASVTVLAVTDNAQDEPTDLDTTSTDGATIVQEGFHIGTLTAAAPGNDSTFTFTGSGFYEGFAPLLEVQVQQNGANLETAGLVVTVPTGSGLSAFPALDATGAALCNAMIANPTVLGFYLWAEPGVYDSTAGTQAVTVEVQAAPAGDPAPCTPVTVVEQ